MREKKLSRRAVIGSAGGAAVAGSALGRLGASAFAAGQQAGDAAVGTVTEQRGGVVAAVTRDGRRHEGAVQSNRPLSRGDRVVVLEQPDGSEVVQPLYVNVTGVVDSVDGRSIVVAGERYRIDRASVARKIQNGNWVDVGTVGESARRGGAIEALGISNAETGATTLAVAFV